MIIFIRRISEFSIFPYQHLIIIHYVRRNSHLPKILRTPLPTLNKLYGDFGFSPISSVPAPHWHSPRTEEYNFFRISPYATTYIKQVVRRFWLFINFLRTCTSLALHCAPCQGHACIKPPHFYFHYNPTGFSPCVLYL